MISVQTLVQGLDATLVDAYAEGPYATGCRFFASGFAGTD